MEESWLEKRGFPEEAQCWGILTMHVNLLESAFFSALKMKVGGMRVTVTIIFHDLR
jgi:hypothetical protein